MISHLTSLSTQISTKYINGQPGPALTCYRS